jgi:hypothetical protein
VICLYFDPQRRLFMDQQGLPVSKQATQSLLPKIAEHLAHGDDEIVALAQAQIRAHHPRMEKQMDWDFFRSDL